MSTRGRTLLLLAGAVVIAVDVALAALGVGYGPRFGAALAFWGVAVVLRRPGVGARESGHAAGPPLTWNRELALHTARTLGVCTLATLVLAGSALLVVRLGDVRFELVPTNFERADQFRGWLLHAVLLAPPVEELVYRGLAQPRLTRALGRRPAILISALSFWMYHWVVYGGVTPANQLVGGLIMAWSFDRSRSLWPPILLHAAGNLLVGLGDLWVISRPEDLTRLLGWG